MKKKTSFKKKKYKTNDLDHAIDQEKNQVVRSFFYKLPAQVDGVYVDHLRDQRIIFITI